jgi:hypothetical protein
LSTLDVREENKALGPSFPAAAVVVYGFNAGEIGARVTLFQLLGRSEIWMSFAN